MNNIRILPTNKVTKVHFDSKLFISPNYQLSKTINSIVQGRNIYITNDEKPKSGDWCYVPNQMLGYEHIQQITTETIETLDSIGAKKIIMTTDPDLIKDGVQGIPEDFLKWLVDNPECEYVEVYNDKNVGYEYDHYSIIIPEKCTCEVGHPYNNLCCRIHGKIDNDDDGLVEIKEPIGKFIIENATPVQGNDGAYFHYSDVCKLLKLQQKNMITKENVKNTLYNDDEVKLILGKLMGDIFRGKGVHLNEWFEENKKK